MSPREPLWQKLANRLVQRIASGRYPLGSLLPTELELSCSEGVSRNTVRAALAEVQSRGLIVRKTHEGTRVISTGGAANFHQKLSSLEDIARFGHDYEREITDLCFVTADERIANAINCEKGTRFLRFSNIRRGLDVEDPAVVFTKVFISPDYQDVVASAQTHPDELIISLIENMHRVRCVRVTQSIQAVALPETAAKKLGATAGAPALRILRHYLDRKGRVLEISVSYHPGQRYAFNMTLERTQRAARGTTHADAREA